MRRALGKFRPISPWWVDMLPGSPVRGLTARLQAPASIGVSWPVRRVGRALFRSRGPHPAYRQPLGERLYDGPLYSGPYDRTFRWWQQAQSQDAPLWQISTRLQLSHALAEIFEQQGVDDGPAFP